MFVQTIQTAMPGYSRVGKNREVKRAVEALQQVREENHATSR
jgi:hypothetical protein